MSRTVLLWVLIFSSAGTVDKAAAQDTTTGAANRHMHRNPVDRLVRAFESEERQSWQKPEEVIGRFGDLSSKTVMDLGAASGYFTLRLAQHALRVIAADVDDRFLSHLKDRLSREQNAGLRKKIELRKVPYDDPGLKPEEVDAVLVVNTYHHIEDRVEYVGKLLEGLSPGGQLLIVDYLPGVDFGPPDAHKLALETVQDEVAQAGFVEIVTDTTTLPYQYMVLCTK